MTYLCGITVDELCECSSEACVECSLTFRDVDVIVNADVQCQQAHVAQSCSLFFTSNGRFG